MTEYIITLLPGSGIGSAIIYIISGLCYLKKNNINIIPIVNLYFASKPVKIFFEHFIDIENITAVTFINSSEIKYNPKSNDTSKYKELFRVKETNIVYSEICENKFVDIYVEQIKQIWKLNSKIINECKELNNYDICINIRRGDKITLEPYLCITNTNKYVDKIMEIGLDNPTIFHTSDDYNTLLELKTLNNNLNISSFCTTNDNGFFLSDINTKNDSYIIEHINKFIKELYMMTNSTYFIGIKSTNVGYLALLLRQSELKTNSIFLD